MSSIHKIKKRDSQYSQQSEKEDSSDVLSKHCFLVEFKNDSVDFGHNDNTRHSLCNNMCLTHDGVLPNVPPKIVSRQGQHYQHSNVLVNDVTNTTSRIIPASGRNQSILTKLRCFKERCKKMRCSLLFLYSTGLLLSSCGNSIYFKKMTSAMPNYGWFLSQFTCFIYVPIFGIIVMMSISKGYITLEMRRYPMYPLIIMGCLDSLLCLMSIIGGAFTSGPSQLVLSQGVIPLTLCISSFFLKERYHVLHYIGALIIIIGVMVSKLRLNNSHMYNDNMDSQNIPIFNLIFAAAAIPNAISQVYKEFAFKYHHLDVNYMQYWVSIYQLLTGILIAPLNALPLLQTQRIPLNKMPRMLIDGGRCLFFQQNSIIQNCNTYNTPLCDACNQSWIPVTIYLLFNIAYNIFTLLIVKHGGATYCFVITTLRLPLTTLCFYSHYIMGPYAIAPEPQDFISLGVLLLGLIIYRYGGKQQYKTNEFSGTLEQNIAYPMIVEPLISQEDILPEVGDYKKDGMYLHRNK